VAAFGRLGRGVVAQLATRRTAQWQQELRSNNVGGGAEAVVAAAGRLSRGVVAGRLAQWVTRHTLQWQQQVQWRQELRSDNVGGGAEAAVAGAGRLAGAGRVRKSRGVKVAVTVCGGLSGAGRARRTSWSRDEVDVLNEAYARLGMSRACMLKCPCAHTCMYVCTMNREYSTHIHTHKHMQPMTRTCVYAYTHILHIDVFVKYTR